MITPDYLRRLAQNDLTREQSGLSPKRHEMRKAIRQAAAALEEAAALLAEAEEARS